MFIQYTQKVFKKHSSLLIWQIGSIGRNREAYNPFGIHGVKLLARDQN